MQGCETCQSSKAGTTRPKPPPAPISTSEWQNPFQTISIDLITDLPKSRGYDSILTIVDHGCSKVAIFLPCCKTIDTAGVAGLYAKRVFPFFSIPRRVISDRDLRFTARFTKEFCGILKIDQNLSTAYHPQTNGQSEWANQRIEQYLRIYGNAEQNDWVDLLPMAQYTHNAWRNKSTQATPFNLLIGHTPTIQVKEKDLAVPEIARRKEWLERGRIRAFAALRNAQRIIVQRAQRKKGERHYLGFKEGELVWLEGTNLQLSHPNAKLAPKQYRPFRVLEQISPVIF
jgi:hypothetical protein